MSNEDKPHFFKDFIIPLLAIAASGLAALMSYTTSRSQNELQVSQQELQSKIAQLQSDQAKKEFRLDVYVKSYDLVEKALEEKSAPAADFARQVIALVEDPEIQESLYKYLENTVQKTANEKPDTDKSKQALQKIIERTQADQQILQAQTQPSSILLSNDSDVLDLKGWRIQVMYCEREKSALNIATELATSIATYTGAKSSLTSVSTTAESKVSNASLNINYSHADNSEMAIAEKVSALLGSLGIVNTEFQLRPVSTDFGDHLSIYVCL